MKLVLVIVLFFCSGHPGFAQTTESVHLSKYTQKEGLPSYNVRKVIQDSKGFIWVATQDGISRFDGKTFLNYSKSSLKKNKICGVDVREIIEDTAKNLLWILSTEVGINAISTITGEVVITAAIPGVSADDWNMSMKKDKDILWIGTSTGVRSYNTNTNTYENSLPLPRPPLISTDFETRSIIKDEYDNIWACYSGFGIVIYNGKTRKIIKEVLLDQLNDHDKSHNIRFYSYAITGTGEIIFATSQGLRKISYTKSYLLKIDNNPCKRIPSFNTENIDYIAAYKPQGIFVAGYNKFCRFDALLDTYTNFQEPARTTEADWLNAVQSIYQDRENNTWLGCQEGLAFIPNKPSPFIPFIYDKLTNTKLDHARSLYVSNDGNILVGLRNGIVDIQPSDKKYIKYDTGHLYHHIFSDNRGAIHVSRPDGMFIYKNGSLTPIGKIYPEFIPYASFPINSHLIVNDSLVILGTESNNGILLWNPLQKKVKNIDQHTAKDLISSSIVNNIYRDSKGNTWVLSDNVINIIAPDFSSSRKITPVEKETNLPYNLFFDMCQLGGFYWITTYGSGVLQLDSSFKVVKILNTEYGLSNDGVYQVYAITQNKILITSNNGISVYNVETNKFQNYFQNDGLHSNSFEEVCGLRKDSLIYAGGLNGFTVIDPKYLSDNHTPPLLYFTNIKVESSRNNIDTSNLLLSNFIIQPNWLTATISFTGLNYFNPNRTTYKYMISEIHKNWVSLSTQNSISLIGLPPGTYHLQVQAFNEDGVPSEIKELTLVFLPKWYQTWWFKLLLILAGMSGVYIVYRIRINQLKKEQQIRSKLASDLHDDLGSTMNSIKVYANLATMDKNQSDKYVLKIKESTQEAITGIRDMIWVLDDRKDSIEDLISRIASFASPLCEANNIQYKQQTDDDARYYKLGQAERRNLYMILKEAINNSIKYSSPKKIEINISARKKKPKIIVSDDGKGFDTSKQSEGYGLKNMRRRAKEIKYYFGIESTPQSGTRIELEKI